MDTIAKSDIRREAIWQPLGSIDKECFACGPENPHGLRMCLEYNGVQNRSKLLVLEEFRGWSNLIHGEILSTLLNETMSFQRMAIMPEEDVEAMTCGLISV